MKIRRIFLRPGDIKLLHDVSSKQASFIYQHLKDVLSKAKQHKVTIEEYCHYYGVSVDTVYLTLKTLYHADHYRFYLRALFRYLRRNHHRL